MKTALLALTAASLVGGTAAAAPATFIIDPNHTYPAFEADHFGGLSVWRGKFTKSSGKLIFDEAAKSGTVEIVIDTASIDFGHDGMNEHAKAADFFDVTKFPTATFKGKLAAFKGNSPTQVQGTLTMRGITKPVTLTVNSFMCKEHPLNKKYTCGTDASAVINRADFGMDYGKALGFKMETKLLITAEAAKAN